MFQATMALIGAVILLAGTARVSAQQQVEIAGRATAVSGDVISLSGREIRLFGIDAPESDQVCSARGRKIRCGLLATGALTDLLIGSSVRCRPVGAGGEDGDGAIVARCDADGFDLSGNMVYTGWALNDPRQTKSYQGIEDGARRARRGLWRGQFDPPWVWRARHQ